MAEFVPDDSMIAASDTSLLHAALARSLTDSERTEIVCALLKGGDARWHPGTGPFDNYERLPEGRWRAYEVQLRQTNFPKDVTGWNNKMA